MKLADAMTQHPPIAAPRQDRGLLVIPSWHELPAHLSANMAARRDHTIDIQGRSLLKLSQQARRQLLADARDYTQQYRGVPATHENADAPLILAGHQPRLFHPGVWCKNFALARLAQQQGAAAVNLLIDSDAVRSNSSRVPGGTLAKPTLTAIPLDTPPEAGLPFEECAIRNAALFASFGERAEKTISSLVPAPLVREYWPRALERAKATGNLGLALAQSRHMQEAAWGLETLELPQSRCCQGEPFFYFVTHVLAHLPRMWDIYNASLAEFRRAQKIRSAAHPVPDLAAEHEWLEAPFWIWTTDDPRRRPLFVKSCGDRLVLSDRVGGSWKIEASADADAQRAAAQLAEYTAAGLRLRTRALSTTMYARLFLSDLFIHGIGGSKYDELTDVLIERFFGLTPPSYATFSATLRLPLGQGEIDPSMLGQFDHRIRALSHHPEVHIQANPQQAPSRHNGLGGLIARKRKWIDSPLTPESAAQRHRELAEINRALQPYVADAVADLEQQRERLRQELRSAKILASREYDYCLYPADMLRQFLCDELPVRLNAAG